MKKALTLLAVVLLSGCTTTWQKATPEEYVNKKLKFSAAIPADWMYFPSQSFVSTKDGTLLDSISVERVKFNTPLAATKKQYKPDMLVVDLADVDIDNYRSDGDRLHFKVLENKVVTVGGKDAYCLKFNYQTQEGLKRKCVVYGLVHDNYVYRIVYSAAEQHYYDLYEKSFEDFVKSLKLL